MRPAPMLALAALLALPLAAQEQTESTDQPGAEESVAGATAAGATAAAAADAAATPDALPEDSENSPFDYRASEQISEDLSVSFPVDI